MGEALRIAGPLGWDTEFHGWRFDLCGIRAICLLEGRSEVKCRTPNQGGGQILFVSDVWCIPG